MRRDVAHHGAADQHVDGRQSELPPPWRLAGARLRGQGLDETRRRFEIAHEQQILDERDDRRHHGTPAVVVFLDAQDVENQRQIQRSERRCRHRRKPRGDTLRGVIGCLLQIDGPRSGARQLAPVGIRNVRLVRVRGEQVLCDVAPDALESLAGAKR